MTPRIPDFFIVGHPKCGTTALFQILRRHPQIYMPAVKEAQFFASEERYRGRPEMSLDEYFALFSGAPDGHRAGEASVLYLWSRTAATRIAEVQPKAQIIAILREPASFLHSLHLQLVQGQVEMEKDFGKALALEERRRRGEHDARSLACAPTMLLYGDYVQYVDQLRRYEAAFSPDRVLTLVYDDFRRDNEGAVRAVMRFLEVDDAVALEQTEANPTVRVRSQRLNILTRSVYKGSGPISRTAKATIKAIVPSRRVRRRMLDATQRRVVYADPQQPDEDLMLELRRRFKPQVEAASEHLGRDLVALWGYDRI